MANQKQRTGKNPFSTKVNLKSLLTVLPTLGVDKTRSQSFAMRSVSTPGTISSSSFLVNPILAFVKAYKLRGDSANLSSTLSAKFDACTVDEALKSLWAFCHADLARLGFTYHARRSSDPVQLFNTILGDLIIAFDKLDLDGCLPPIYCEAADLVTLPTLDLDPVAKQVELNTVAVRGLSDTIRELQFENRNVSDNEVVGLSSRIDSLRELVKSAERLKDELATSVKAATSCLSASTVSGDGNSHVSRSTASSAVKLQPKSSSSFSDRRFNVILFGIPEKKSLADEKCSVDEVFNFVAGKSVPWNDAFRIGRKKQPVDSPEGSGEDRRPRPLLVKVSSEWDRRILLSSRYKLKDYVAARVFLREDLPLDIRKDRAKQRNERRNNPPPPLGSDCDTVLDKGEVTPVSDDSSGLHSQSGEP